MLVRRSLFSQLTCLIAALGVAGCATPHIRDFCGDELQSLNQEWGHALQDIEVDPSLKRSGRGLASLNPFADRKSEDESPLRGWEDWAESQLADTQSVLDGLRSLEAGHEERGKVAVKHLSAVANELVFFHGYAAQRSQDKMKRSLERIQRHGKAARKRACD